MHLICYWLLCVSESVFLKWTLSQDDTNAGIFILHSFPANKEYVRVLYCGLGVSFVLKMATWTVCDITWNACKEMQLEEGSILHFLQNKNEFYLHSLTFISLLESIMKTGKVMANDITLGYYVLSLVLFKNHNQHSGTHIYLYLKLDFPQ